jgi:hypothetical protein
MELKHIDYSHRFFFQEAQTKKDRKNTLEIYEDSVKN